eukprot:CAMPEP_0194206702 /NCGR_PEP_ID=MMETSP0156-20130528/5660_1 /TAXON_ID=33649 /ORGANISM="Thalassionema nitzschioides, Strain L26-B" /LENGTH=83 /DNA_ID=CAMNT_0038933293 /DNA_START=8 /DNA_END=256 /DNA_ORIENTATION=-
MSPEQQQQRRVEETAAVVLSNREQIDKILKNLRSSNRFGEAAEEMDTLFQELSKDSGGHDIITCELNVNILVSCRASLESHSH